LKIGAAFGELALLAEDSLRQATVTCETDVLFATLDRYHFKRACKSIQDRYDVETFNFLNGIPCFKGVAKKYI